MNDTRAIPNLTNAIVVAGQFSIVCACIIACKTIEGWWWILIMASFIIVMNSVYFAIHEAEHGVLFSNRYVNDLVGTTLSLFLPASFTLVRRVHLAHHIHNRSDEEVFDFYFENEPAWWKKLQFFGILTGGFWLTMVIGNLALVIMPMRWLVKAMEVDRPSRTVMQYVDRHYTWRIRCEAWVAIVLHSAIIWWLGRRAIEYSAMYAAFGISWSTLQYMHHYGTSRDVLRGAKNLRYGALLNALWLNHGWHLTHHLHPTLSWRYLPKAAGDDQQPSESLGTAYLKMWRGPTLTSEHVKNRYEGNVG